MNIKENISGKTIVITGSTSGIGFATALLLAKHGANIIGIGRSDSKCRRAEDSIRSSCKDPHVAYIVADLSSLKQVKELAKNIRQRLGNGKIDVLINAAGTFTSWYVNTVDGFEMQFAVNYLAPFLLTNELMPLLKRSPAGRIITVSSGSHYRTAINWKDIMLRKHYNCLMAYKQSKLADVLFTMELNRRMGQMSTVRAFAADPGLVNTDIGFKGTSGIARWIWKIRRSSGTNPSVAAESIAFLSCEPSIQHSENIYWKDCKPLKPSRYSQRADAAQRLWEISKRMCARYMLDPASGYTNMSEE